MRWSIPLLLCAACAFPDEDFDEDGFSASQGDCEDLDARVHPGAFDALGDGVDQDCDGIDPVMAVSGLEHTCVLGSSGMVVCEGENALGQLEIPEGELTWVKLAAGDHHTCALADGGAVNCWGDDQFNQSSPPDAAFVDIDAGFDWSLGVLANGEALCWGRCLILPAG